jgi:hypothetical protein
MISEFHLLLGHPKSTCLINRLSVVRHRRGRRTRRKRPVRDTPCIGTASVSVERKQKDIGNIVVVGV